MMMLGQDLPAEGVISSTGYRVLLFDARSSNASELKSLLLGEAADGLEVVHCQQMDQLLYALAHDPPDAVLLGIGRPDHQALSTFATVQLSADAVPIVVFGTTCDRPLLVRALQHGARDHLLIDELYPTLVVRSLLYTVETHRAERARRASDEIRRQMAENSRDVFWIATPDHSKMQYVSTASESVIGITPEQLYANPKLWFDSIHPDDQPRIRVVLHDHPFHEFEAEYRVIRPNDGETRWVYDRSFPIRDEQGQLTLVAGIAVDITDRKRLEEQLRQSARLEAVGQLAAGIAHDFNNVLHVVSGNAQLLELVADESVQSLASEIVSASERASSLVRQLLAFSRKQVLETKPLVVNEVVDEVTRMIDRVLRCDIEIRTILDPSVGWVQADPGQLHQVVMNLVVNARNAMPDGGVLTLRTCNSQLSKADAAKYPYTVIPGSYVRLQVHDTGIGMDESIMQKIFEPFFTTRGADGGSGLGLSSVYGIVKQSQGYIWVRSQPGHGTEFDVYLPRIPEPLV